jgi:hypothetical protein
METENICNFCNKKFLNIYTLQNHIKNAKNCIKKRNQTINSESENKCKFCNTKFSTKQKLNFHLNNCDSIQPFFKKIDEIKEIENKLQESNRKISEQAIRMNTFFDKIIELKKQEKITEKTFNNRYKEMERLYIERLKDKDKVISDLQKELSRVTDKAIEKQSIINNNKTITKNTQYNHIESVNLSQENVRKKIQENISLIDIQKGLVGYIEFLIKNFLTDKEGKYLSWCSDKARKSIKFIDDKKMLIDDMNGQSLFETTYFPYLENVKLVRQIFMDIYYDCEDGNYTNKKLEDIEFPYFFDEDDEDDLDEDDIKTKIKKVNKLIREIKSFKDNYNPERVAFYFQKLNQGISELEDVILNNYNEASKQLSLKLPKNPFSEKKINKSEIEI